MESVKILCCHDFPPMRERAKFPKLIHDTALMIYRIFKMIVIITLNGWGPQSCHYEFLLRKAKACKRTCPNSTREDPE